jgi:hypothetical protein
MNLKARYGQTYRIAREDGADRHDPAGFIIPCKCGQIYAHGRELLGIATNGRSPIVKRLATLPGHKVTQDGGDGTNARFKPELFAAVASIVRPKRKRKLSAAHRAKLLAASRPFRPKNCASKCRNSELERDGTASVVQSAALAV